MEVINLGNFIVNNYLIKLDRTYILIDTGYESGYKKFKNNLRKYNIKLTDIKYIFLTHGHDDHAGFLNRLLVENPEIKIILATKAVEALRNGQNSFTGGCSNRLALIFCNIMALFGKGAHKFPKLNYEFENNLIFYNSPEGKVLQENLSLKFIETPGHTSCSISLLYKKILFCGDAAMNGFPSLNNITIWIENLKEYKSSWKKMIELNPEKIYTGHGKPIIIKNLLNNIGEIENRKLLKLKFKV